MPIKCGDIERQLLINEVLGIVDRNSHRKLDQLVHNISEDSYEEFEYIGNKVVHIDLWTDNTKTLKIREEDFTYENNKVKTATIIQYDASGREVERFVETYTYSCNKIISVDKDFTRNA